MTSIPPCLARIALAALVLIALAGCTRETIAQTPFEREAQDAASVLSAAATTIEYVHDGQLDARYARSSLDIYRNALRGTADTLPSQDGAPGEAELAPAIDGLRASEAVLTAPCLDDTCDWRTQVATLDDATRLLLDLSQ